MAQNDDAVKTATRGYVFSGAANATRPTQTAINTYVSAGTVPSGLTELGHTSREDVLAFGQDEGDTEVKGTWQTPALREVTTSEAVDYFVINYHEVTNETLERYYGGGDISVEGVFQTPTSTSAVEESILVIMVDGADVLSMWVPKVSSRREDAPEFSVEDFTIFPIRHTVLTPTSGGPIQWIHPDLGDQTP